MSQRSGSMNRYAEIAFGVLFLLGLYVIGQRNFLLFHSLTEMFSIVIAFGIFMIAWNSRRFMENNYLLYLGISYLFTGGLDLVHTLTYSGMGVFPDFDANPPTQLWIAARFTESVSFFMAPIFLNRHLKPVAVFLSYGFYTVLVMLSIFYWEIFPDCYVPGVGLTPFKKTGEYIVSLVLAVSIIALTRKRDQFNPSVYRLLVISIGVTVAAEIVFTFYIDVYGFSNFMGHCFKAISFYFIYKALIATGLEHPYSLLFMNLKQSEQSLRESERKLMTLLSNLPGMAYRCLNDANWTMEFVSQGCRQLTGYEPADLVHNSRLSYNDLIHVDDRKAVWDRVQEGVAGKKPFEMIYRIQTTNGEVNWVWEKGVGIFSEQGELEALEGFVSDISDRVKAEDERLQREKLQSVLETAGAVCHELNQPLQSIVGYSELLLLDIAKEDPAHEKVRIVFEQAERMGKITRKLMKITRYKTKDYGDGSKIIDIEKSSRKDE